MAISNLTAQHANDHQFEIPAPQDDKAPFMRP